MLCFQVTDTVLTTDTTKGDPVCTQKFEDCLDDV